MTLDDQPQPARALSSDPEEGLEIPRENTTEEFEQMIREEEADLPDECLTLELVCRMHLSGSWVDSTGEEEWAVAASKITHVRADRQRLAAISPELLPVLQPCCTNLYLQHNRLASLQAVAALPTLRFLAASHNRIAEAAGLAALPNLMFLDLSHNRLTLLQHQQLPRSLRILKIDGNPVVQKRGRMLHLDLVAELPLLNSLDDHDVTPRDRAAARRVLGLELLQSDGNEDADEDDDDEEEEDEEGSSDSDGSAAEPPLAWLRGVEAGEKLGEGERAAGGLVEGEGPAQLPRLAGILDALDDMEGAMLARRGSHLAALSVPLATAAAPADADATEVAEERHALLEQDRQALAAAVNRILRSACGGGCTAGGGSSAGGGCTATQAESSQLPGEEMGELADEPLAAALHQLKERVTARLEVSRQRVQLLRSRGASTDEKLAALAQRPLPIAPSPHLFPSTSPPAAAEPGCRTPPQAPAPPLVEARRHGDTATVTVAAIRASEPAGSDRCPSAADALPGSHRPTPPTAQPPASA